MTEHKFKLGYELYERGMAFRQIAQHLGFHSTTWSRFINGFKSGGRRKLYIMLKKTRGEYRKGNSSDENKEIEQTAFMQELYLKHYERV